MCVRACVTVCAFVHVCVPACVCVCVCVCVCMYYVRSRVCVGAHGVTSEWHQEELARPCCF